MRINVQLIKATTDAHLWADTYDRKLTDIFAVESEIAKNDRRYVTGEANRFRTTRDCSTTDPEYPKRTSFI